MILYYPYAEALYDHPRLADSRKFLDILRAAHPDWTIIEQACGKDTRYEDGFKALWGQDDLIVLEQDPPMLENPKSVSGLTADTTHLTIDPGTTTKYTGFVRVWGF